MGYTNGRGQRVRGRAPKACRCECHEYGGQARDLCAACRRDDLMEDPESGQWLTVRTVLARERKERREVAGVIGAATRYRIKGGG